MSTSLPRMLKLWEQSVGLGRGGKVAFGESAPHRAIWTQKNKHPDRFQIEIGRHQGHTFNLIGVGRFRIAKLAPCQQYL